MLMQAFLRADKEAFYSSVMGKPFCRASGQAWTLGFISAKRVNAYRSLQG